MSISGLHGRIRALRRRQQRTLKDVADKCGFTVSLLSKIESGKSVPPMATLSKIAKALGTNLSGILEGESGAGTVHTSSARLPEVTRTDKGYLFRLLAGERGEKIMQPFLMEARRGKVRQSAMSHGGEEFIYVLEGRMNYRVGELTYAVGPGDSLYFDAEEEHDLEPLTEEVRYLAIFAERNPLVARAGKRKETMK